MTINFSDPHRDGFEVFRRFAPKAITATAYSQNGGDFDKAQAQYIINPRDPASTLVWEVSMAIWGDKVIAYHDSRGPGFVSLEILYADDVAGEAVSFYNRAPKKLTRAWIEKVAKKYPAAEPFTTVLH